MKAVIPFKKLDAELRGSLVFSFSIPFVGATDSGNGKAECFRKGSITLLALGPKLLMVDTKTPCSVPSLGKSCSFLITDLGNI